VRWLAVTVRKIERCIGTKPHPRAKCASAPREQLPAQLQYVGAEMTSTGMKHTAQTNLTATELLASHADLSLELLRQLLDKHGVGTLGCLLDSALLN
jgi:hypothetical protein